MVWHGRYSCKITNHLGTRKAFILVVDPCKCASVPTKPAKHERVGLAALLQGSELRSGPDSPLSGFCGVSSVSSYCK